MLLILLLQYEYNTQGYVVLPAYTVQASSDDGVWEAKSCPHHWRKLEIYIDTNNIYIVLTMVWGLS